MSTNVMVTCRFRPPSKTEKLDGASIVAQVDPNNTSVIVGDGTQPATLGSNKFNFDRVFDFVSSQAEVFKHTAQPLVKEIFAGYNCTVFAYGQTGSGKTHTMMGKALDPELKGIIPRLVEALFNGIEEAEVGIEFTVKISYVEIYNERIRDLLTARNANSDNLKIREMTHGGVYIEGVTETYVNSIDQVLALMEQGQAARALASTNMNEQSSRSHSVFVLTLGQLNTETGSKKGAKLTLVDLAGSEKVGKTGAAGQTLLEAQAINKSLSALGNVINALSSGAPFVPYRDSKLTRLLSDSLGGNSKTCLVVTGSPMSTNMEETISTLRFGTRAKQIKNVARINQEKSVAEYKLLLAQAEVKLGVQTNIIGLLEQDVANLLECIQAVDPTHLKLPLPALLSRDVAALEAAKKAKAMSSEEPSELPSLASTTALPPPSTAASATDTPAASEPVSVAASPAMPPRAKPIRSSATSDESPATSAESSPATSPDNTPPGTPPTQPVAAPPVVTMGLPSLASLSLSTQATNVPAPRVISPANAASSAATVPHSSLSELMLANSDLSHQLEEMRLARRALEHNLEDARKEAAEAQETWNAERARLQAQLDAIGAQRREAEEKAEKASEMTTEFALMKQKVEYMAKEHALQMSQVEEEKIGLTEELANWKNRLVALEAKMHAQQRAYEAVMEQVAAENATSLGASLEPPAPASAPGSPQLDAEQRKAAAAKARARMSAPPERLAAAAPHPLAAGSASAVPSLPTAYEEPTYTPEEQSQIDQLNRGLKRKCDQYIQLMMQHQTQGERVASLESALEDANARLKEHMASSARKVKELDEKLLAAENLCAKFLESGRYWRQERNQKSKAAASTAAGSTSKIVMPLHGGGGRSAMSAMSASSYGSPARASISGASSAASPLSPATIPGAPGTVTSPTAPGVSSATGSHARRQSVGGGLASGARSAITSITSAISGKPKDNMSTFF